MLSTERLCECIRLLAFRCGLMLDYNMMANYARGECRPGLECLATAPESSQRVTSMIRGMLVSGELDIDASLTRG